MANWVHGHVFCRADDIDAFQFVLQHAPRKRAPIGEFRLQQAVPQVPQGEAIIGKPFIYEHTGGDRYGSGETVFDGFESSTFEMGKEHGTYVICWAKRDADLERLEHHMHLRKRTLEKLGVKELP